jgi:hypothetical protein
MKKEIARLSALLKKNDSSIKEKDSLISFMKEKNPSLWQIKEKHREEWLSLRKTVLSALEAHDDDRLVAMLGSIFEFAPQDVEKISKGRKKGIFGF